MCLGPVRIGHVFGTMFAAQCCTAASRYSGIPLTLCLLGRLPYINSSICSCHGLGNQASELPLLRSYTFLASLLPFITTVSSAGRLTSWFVHISKHSAWSPAQAVMHGRTDPGGCRICSCFIRPRWPLSTLCQHEGPGDRAGILVCCCSLEGRSSTHIEPSVPLYCK